ncbi:MAG TPA: PHP domain-containing protein [Fluviicoccus sp.]|nr:PHP domain-containing protein [Fluviicoccus sp.]
MPTIDLHSHSLYSDGSLSPSDLFSLAAERGIEALALTDHDSIAGLPEARAAALANGLRLVPGVEISALWGKTLVHVLGLAIDDASPELCRHLREQAGARGRRARLIADRLQELGQGDSWPVVLEAASGDADRVGRTHFARYLLATGRVRNLQQAFNKFLAEGKPAAVPIPWVGLTEAVAWIRSAGGVPVLAHPSRYGLSQTRLRLLLQEFREAGGLGMEVSSGSEKPNVVQQLAALAQRFGLHASQGSDYHGAHMPWLKLGVFPDLPKGCRPVWELF